MQNFEWVTFAIKDLLYRRGERGTHTHVIDTRRKDGVRLLQFKGNAEILGLPDIETAKAIAEMQAAESE